MYESLRTDKDASQGARGRCLRFLANVDPVDVSRALTGLDPSETLVVIVSKTFTTAESMLNARSLRHWLLTAMGTGAGGAGCDAQTVVRQHIVAVR